MKRKRQSSSDVSRNPPLRQMEEEPWREILHYGEHRAREQGLGPADVARVVEEYRAEGGPRTK